MDLHIFSDPDPKHSLTGNQIIEKMLFSSENLKIAWEPPLKCQMASVLGPGMVYDFQSFNFPDESGSAQGRGGGTDFNFCKRLIKYFSPFPLGGDC